eukprot:TRINITY_DN3500_c0_g2_i1.p2 TRINITY_DN3500_c0_g2~~TRINITY_DN3500_c0_g2_i1.p2  ORF type:complete len:108 (-),score=41.15 TRINITY_DN3500_c0_g2_i1:8-331(-)
MSDKGYVIVWTSQSVTVWGLNCGMKIVAEYVLEEGEIVGCGVYERKSAVVIVLAEGKVVGLDVETLNRLGESWVRGEKEGEGEVGGVLVIEEEKNNGYYLGKRSFVS